MITCDIVKARDGRISIIHGVSWKSFWRNWAGAWVLLCAGLKLGLMGRMAISFHFYDPKIEKKLKALE